VEACEYLNVTDQTVRTWVYKGVVKAKKQPRGPRGFRWVVSVAHLRPLKIEQAARIERERAWMQEPETAAVAQITTDQPTSIEVDTISEGEFVSMFGSDPANDAREAQKKRRRWLDSLKVDIDRGLDDDEA
jgi:hypothetical protein